MTEMWGSLLNRLQLMLISKYIINKRAIVFTIALLLSFNLYGQKTNFTGFVYDSENNEPVVSAVVQILGLERYEVTNLMEIYFFNIP